MSSRRSFLKTTAALTAGSLLPTRALRAAPPAPLVAYVGTYSSPLPVVRPGQVDLPAGNGKGIHIFTVDRRTGGLTPAGIFELNTSPNALAMNAAGTRLYSTNETERLQQMDAGSISAFAIDQATGQLTLMNTVSSMGAGPAHLSVHPSGRYVLVANYFGGSVAVLPILPDGRLGSATDCHQGSGTPGPKRALNAPGGSFAISGHDQPHAHMIATDPAGKFIISTDLGLDQILVWKLDERTGMLMPNDPPSIAMPAGDGPRHFAFHPAGSWFYCLQEEGSTIVFFAYDSALGQLTPRQTISCLPPGFAGSNFTSEIAVSTDGRFVYVANRLHDSIACFAIDPQSGQLAFVAEEWTRGDYPRSFNFDPTGNFLYSCNQRSDAVAVFRVDRASGQLRFTEQLVPVGNPSAILFLDLAGR